MQISRFRGSLTVMSFRLCSRAPWTTSSSAAIRTGILPPERVFGQPLPDELLHDLEHLARLGHVVDLELPRDDRPVAEQPPEQRLLELDRAEPCQMHRSGPPPQGPVHHKELLRRYHQMRSV